MFLTLKLHRNLNDTWRAKRTLAHASEEQIAEFCHRIQETAMRKKTRSRRSSKKRSRQRAAANQTADSASNNA